MTTKTIIGLFLIVFLIGCTGVNDKVIIQTQEEAYEQLISSQKRIADGHKDMFIQISLIMGNGTQN